MLQTENSASRQKNTFPPYSFLEHLNSDHKNYVVVNWCVGNVCNFSCSYCPEGLHDGTHPWPQYETIANFCRRAVEHYQGKTVYFEFTGGEMTLWKDLKRLASELSKVDCRIGIISNGSRSQEYWKTLIPLIDHVCLSFHPESAKPDHFLDIVKMCSQDIRTHVNFMMHPDYFPQCLELAYKVKEIHNISLAVQPLSENMDGNMYPYTELQKEIVNKQNAFLSQQIQHDRSFEYYRGAMKMVGDDGNEVRMAPQRFISSGNNSWKGWSCYAGVEQIVIDMAGDIYRGWCNEGGVIGNIADDVLELPTQPVICGRDFCHCNLDIMTSKVSPTVSQEMALNQC